MFLFFHVVLLFLQSHLTTRGVEVAVILIFFLGLGEDPKVGRGSVFSELQTIIVDLMSWLFLKGSLGAQINRTLRETSPPLCILMSNIPKDGQNAKLF